MLLNMWCISLIIISAPLLTLGQVSHDADELLNWCIDAQNHKSKPGPESDLYKQCDPWKERACCTYNITRDAHHTNMYNFNYNHCGQIKNMSADCKRHFLQDLCFYECSPNIGPWTVKVTMKTRKERFHKVPLCQSDCNSWYDACADDYTCTDNWGRNFDWDKDGNKCPQHAQCKTFKDIFGTAENFCHKVWDESWEYTSDDQPCMRLWFDGTKGNPNNNVARLKVEELKKMWNTANTGSKRVIFSMSVLINLSILLF